MTQPGGDRRGKGLWLTSPPVRVRPSLTRYRSYGLWLIGWKEAFSALAVRRCVPLWPVAGIPAPIAERPEPLLHLARAVVSVLNDADQHRINVGRGPREVIGTGPGAPTVEWLDRTRAVSREEAKQHFFRVRVYQQKERMALAALFESTFWSVSTLYGTQAENDLRAWFRRYFLDAPEHDKIHPVTDMALGEWGHVLSDFRLSLHRGESLDLPLSPDDLGILQRAVAYWDAQRAIASSVESEIELQPPTPEECGLLDWDPDDPEHDEFDKDPATTSLSLIAGHEATARAWAGLEADLSPDVFERLIAGVLAQQKAKRWERHHNAWDRDFRRDAWEWVKLDR